MDISNFKTRIKGNTSNLKRFFFKDGFGIAIDLTEATIRCQFRFGTKNGEIKADMSIGSGLTVEDVSGGIVVVDAIDPFDWAGGTYYYDILITFSTGVDKTYVGGIMPVIETVTK